MSDRSHLHIMSRCSNHCGERIIQPRQCIMVSSCFQVGQKVAPLCMRVKLISSSFCCRREVSLFSSEMQKANMSVKVTK